MGLKICVVDIKDTSTTNLKGADIVAQNTRKHSSRIRTVHFGGH